MKQPRATAAASAIAGVAVLSASAPLGAQVPELPTLADLGVEYVSGSGLFQLSVSGQLDLEGMHVVYAQAPPPSGLTECETCHIDVGRALRQGEDAIGTYRLRLFADLFLGDHVYSLVELRTDKGLESFSGSMRTRLEQWFVRLTDGAGRIGAQVGRFASPFGSYALRHHSTIDPFVTPPLLYDYRTVLNRWRVPASAQGLLRWQDQPNDLDFPGAPPIWEVPYQWGAMLMGRVGPVDLRLAAMNSAPSSHPRAWRLEWDRFERPSWVASARWKPSASLEIGASYDRGPWMAEPTQGTILPPPGSPPGTQAPGWRDFDQEVISADVAFARGPNMLRLEVVSDRWDVPNVSERATELGLSAEAQRDLAAGVSAALRFGLLDFRPIDDGLGASSPYPDGRRDWDHDVYRYEASVGYRLSRTMGLLFSGYRQEQRGSDDADGTFVGARLWWQF